MKLVLARAFAKMLKMSNVCDEMSDIMPYCDDIHIKL